MKSILSFVITGLLLIAINLYFIPINLFSLANYDLIIYFLMFCIGIIFLGLLIVQRSYLRVFIKIVLFSLSVFAVPLIMKGHDSAFSNMIFSGILGYMVYQYVSNHRIFFLNLLIISLIFIMYYAKNGTLETIFYSIGGGVGRNYVGLYLFNVYLIYYALSIKNKQQPKPYVLFLIFLICVLAGGVSSTITSLFFLFSWLFLGMTSKNRYKVIIVFTIAIMLGFLLRNQFSKTLLYTRLTTINLGVDRVILFSDFYTQLNNNSKIISGLDENAQFHYHPLVKKTFHNLHNSYLNLFVHVGVFSLIYLCFIIYVLVLLFKVNTMLGLLFLGTLIRAVSDGYYFVGFTTDYMLFFLYFIATDKELIQNKIIDNNKLKAIVVRKTR